MSADEYARTSVSELYPLSVGRRPRLGNLNYDPDGRCNATCIRFGFYYANRTVTNASHTISIGLTAMGFDYTYFLPSQQRATSRIYRRRPGVTVTPVRVQYNNIIIVALDRQTNVIPCRAHLQLVVTLPLKPVRTRNKYLYLYVDSESIYYRILATSHIIQYC